MREGTQEGVTHRTSGTLHVCAVPIGNLADASPRLVEVLGRVDAIACEDTRSTRKLLGLLGVAPAPRLLAHHEHNEHAGAAGIVALLEQGAEVALVSDAGTPAVSDPGAWLVAAAHEAGIAVVSVPGPSAVAAALSIAGLHGTGHRFVGFFPRAARELAQLVRDASGDLLVGFESPQRVGATLGAVADIQPSRVVALVREISKLHEEVLRGTAIELAGRVAEGGAVRGECVLVLAPVPEAAGPHGGAVDHRDVAAVLALVEEGVRMKVACRIIGERSGASSRGLYAAALEARSAGREA